MKYISHYFPFFILAMVLYGVLFHFHKQATIIPVLPINSGQQSMQLQFVEMTDPQPEEMITQAQEEKEVIPQKSLITKSKTTETPQINEEKTPEPDKKPDPKKTDSEKKTEQINDKETISTPDPLLTEALPEVHTTNTAGIKIAKQKLQKSIQETSAASDATLKAEIFADKFKLASSTPETKKELATSEQQTPTTNNKIKKTPKTQAKPIEEKAILKQKTNKPTFKKQPATEISSAHNQGVLQEAIVVSGDSPVYPKRAILRNQQGRVVVKLTVTINGKAENPQIISSSGYSILDNAVLRFIQQELFMPAHRGKTKIMSEQVFSFRFELK